MILMIIIIGDFNTSTEIVRGVKKKKVKIRWMSFPPLLSLILSTCTNNCGVLDLTMLPLIKVIFISLILNFSLDPVFFLELCFRL